jgi:ATPases involved in chromosome partitioning
VLLIDADPQANATSGLGIEPKDMSSTIYECLVDDYPVRSATVDTCVKGLRLLGSRIDLVGAELEMISFDRREYRMRDALTAIKDEYEFILIDCAPSLGLITLNALVASDSVIIPVQCEYYALEGLGKLLNTVRLVQANMNPSLSIEGILLTMYTARLKHNNAVVEDVRQHCKGIVFDTIIVRNVRLSEAPSYGKPIVLYDVQSKGNINYLNLAKEVLVNNGYTFESESLLEQESEAETEA